MKLNLGCGERLLRDHINLDWNISPQMKKVSSVCGDIQHLPFKDESFTNIYSHHVLEHFWYQDIPQVLAEAHRALIPSGEFLVIVPNFEWYWEQYQKSKYSDVDIEYFTTAIFGLPLNRGWEHHMGYDEKTLCTIMQRHGFSLKEITSENELTAVFIKDGVRCYH